MRPNIELAQDLKTFLKYEYNAVVLGSSLLLKDFVPNYAWYTAISYNTTHKKFNRYKNTCKVNYVKVYEELKEAIQAAIALHFPDYELELIMRMDISQVACSCIIHGNSE